MPAMTQENTSTFTELEARTKFIMDRDGFLQLVWNATNDETPAKNAAVLRCITEHKYMPLIAALFSAPSENTRDLALGVFNNLLAAETPAVREEAIDVASTDSFFYAVWSLYLNPNTSTAERQRCVFLLTNLFRFARVSNGCCTEFVAALPYLNINDTDFWWMSHFAVKRCSYIAHNYPIDFLMSSIRCINTTIRIQPAQILAMLSDRTPSCLATVPVLNMLTFFHQMLTNSKNTPRFNREMLFALSNYAIEAGVADMLATDDALMDRVLEFGTQEQSVQWLIGNVADRCQSEEALYALRKRESVIRPILKEFGNGKQLEDKLFPELPDFPMELDYDSSTDTEIVDAAAHVYIHAGKPAVEAAPTAYDLLYCSRYTESENVHRLARLVHEAGVTEWAVIPEDMRLTAGDLRALAAIGYVIQGDLIGVCDEVYQMAVAMGLN